MRLLLTNDDGIDSPGLRALAMELHEDGHEIHVIAPEVQRSSIGSARTYDKPLRLIHRELGYPIDGVYAIDGTPADAVFIGVKMFQPDAVVSGVNLGENVGLESLFISGTIGAAIQASLMGLPGIAVSMVVPQDKKFTNSGIPVEYFKLAISIASTIMGMIEAKGWFSGIDVLSINAPDPIKWNGEVVVTDAMSRRLFKEELVKTVDPRGSPIFWRWGHEFDELDPDSDAYWLYRRGSVVVSPISFNKDRKIDTAGLRDALSKIGKIIPS